MKFESFSQLGLHVALNFLIDQEKSPEEAFLPLLLPTEQLRSLPEAQKILDNPRYSCHQFWVELHYLQSGFKEFGEVLPTFDYLADSHWVMMMYTYLIKEMLDGVNSAAFPLVGLVASTQKAYWNEHLCKVGRLTKRFADLREGEEHLGEYIIDTCAYFSSFDRAEIHKVLNARFGGVAPQRNYLIETYVAHGISVAEILLVLGKISWEEFSTYYSPDEIRVNSLDKKVSRVLKAYKLKALRSPLMGLDDDVEFVI